MVMKQQAKVENLQVDRVAQTGPTERDKDRARCWHTPVRYECRDGQQIEGTITTTSAKAATVTLEEQGQEARDGRLKVVLRDGQFSGTMCEVPF